MDEARDTDAGFLAYIFAHPDEFLNDLVALTVAAK
jgi:hypothetical protein